MRLRFVLLVLLTTGVAILSLLPAARGSSSTSLAHQRVAKLVVVVAGDPTEGEHWGFLFDSGERRNGQVWQPVAGLLDPRASRTDLKEAHKRFVLAVTDEPWQPTVPPTEIELVQALAAWGNYRLLQVDDGAFHEFLPNDVTEQVDRVTTYWLTR